MKRKDLVIILAVLALGLALFGVNRLFPPRPSAGSGKTLSLTQLPLSKDAQTTVSEEDEALPPLLQIRVLAAGEALQDAESYLRIKQGNDYYELIPLLSPGRIQIKQQDGKENIIYINYNSAVMHSANCPNRECVHQGMVTLENRDRRVLQNMVICLPNQVSLELLNRDEALALKGKTP